MAPLCTTQYTATELARGAERIDATWEFHHAVYSRVFLTPIHEKDTQRNETFKLTSNDLKFRFPRKFDKISVSTGRFHHILWPSQKTSPLNIQAAVYPAQYGHSQSEKS